MEFALVRFPDSLLAEASRVPIIPGLSRQFCWPDYHMPTTKTASGGPTPQQPFLHFARIAACNRSRSPAGNS